MIILLSPAKRMDFSSALPPVFLADNEDSLLSEPVFSADAWQVARKMKEFSPLELGELLKINTSLSIATAEKFASFRHHPMDIIVRPAILAYNGDAYRGLDASSMSREDLLYAQDHLRILSAVYGLLRPLDRIQAYRLEMSARLQVNGEISLYEYWTRNITRKLKEDLARDDVPIVINLASLEYFSAVDSRQLGARIITPVFKEYRNGTYKILSTHAKFARGRMSRFILNRRIPDPEEIKLFDLDGYAYDANLSTGDRWVFTR